MTGSSPRSISLVLADEHQVFLDALAAALFQRGHRVVATAQTFAEVFRAVRVRRPDVVLGELRLRDGSGAETLAAAVRQAPRTRVVVLTADPTCESMQAAMAAGAAGYVHKTRSMAALVDVLRRVVDGEIVVEASFAPASARPGDRAATMVRLAGYLTPRESECLALLTAGRDTAAIARRLGVSPTTVRSHIQAVLTKLGVHSRLEAAAVAARYNLVRSPEPPIRLVT